MGVGRVGAGLAKALGVVSKAVNIVGVSVLALMMFFTVADVCLRYFFNRPIASSFELTEFMMALVVAFGLAHTALLGGHISVDILTSRLRPVVRAAFSSVSDLISAGIFALVAWQSFVQAEVLHESGLESDVLYLPVSPFVVAAGVGFGLLSLAFLLNFCRSLAQVIEKWNRSR